MFIMTGKRRDLKAKTCESHRGTTKSQGDLILPSPLQLPEVAQIEAVTLDPPYAGRPRSTLATCPPILGLVVLKLNGHLIIVTFG